MSDPVPPPGGDWDHLFPGDSEMAGRMRAFDWATTDLGPPAGWSWHLRTAVSLCLTSRFPILVWWGPAFTVLYNDAYIPFLGPAKHPRSLGRPGREVWAEIWDTIGPMLEGVRATGRATWSDDFPTHFNRAVRREEVYVRFTYGPILAADGRTVDGVFCPCTETTGQVVGARRLETLRQLGVEAGVARTAREACTAAARVLAGNPADVPFAAVYLAGGPAGDWALAAAAGLPEDHPLPGSGSADDGTPWPLARVLRTGRAEEVRAPPLGTGSWPEPPDRAVVLPIVSNHDRAAGLLVAGVSPRRPWDAAYRTFLDLAAGHVGTALAAAAAHEAERRRADALAELDRTKTAFFAGVSHEFRTPLTLMLGPVEDLLADPGGTLAPDDRERLDLVRRNGLRLQKLVNNLLEFARIEAGRAEARPEPTDLAALTADLAGTFRSACERAGLRLAVDCPSLPGPAAVDREMWEKVVLNLLSNAFKFTPAGEVAVRLEARGGDAALTVRDTGVGIPADELPRVFDRFHRVAGARGRTHEGSGIGLALVRELVRLHGGDVRAASTPGQGSTFTVSIPLNPACRPADPAGPAPAPAVTATPFVEEALRWLPESQAPGPPTPSGRPRVLLADDNTDMRGYVGRLLAARYEVEAVADGAAALAAAQDRPPDLVLADVMMPRLDGFGLLRALRADPRTCGVPVVLLSARAGEESRVEGLGAGATDYLVKPFTARELLARVAAHLEVARARREAAERVTRVYESISDGLAVLDREWRYTYVNAAAERMMGRPRAGLLGKRLWDEFPFAAGTEVERQLRRAAGGRENCEFEGYNPDRDRWYENRASPTEDGGVAVYFRDVTDRRRADEALRRSEERFRRYFELGLIGMSITSPAKGILEVNDEICRTLGYTRDELLRTTWAELSHPDDMAADVALFDRVMAGEIDGYVLDKRWVRKDGRVIDGTISVKCLRAAGGAVDYFVALLQDVTDRKRAEQALRESEARLAAELTAVSGLHALAGRLLTAPDAAAALGAVVEAAVALHGADMGTVQVWDPAAGALRFAATRGFDPAALAAIPPVAPDSPSTCAAVVRTGRRAVVEDFEADPAFAAHRGTAAALGYRAAHSTPLTTRQGELLGVFTTHYRSPHRPADRELRLTDLLARQAADWLERDRVEEAVRRARDGLEERVAARTAELARANDALRAEARERERAEASRTDLLRQLATAHEGERRRVARDLHDQLGQQLTALTLGLQAARDRGADPAALARLQQMAEEVARGVHDVALRLRPTALDDFGLAEALRSGVEEWGRAGGAAVALDTDGLGAERLPAEVETALYRVVQEAVHNALKHARARRVNVLVERRHRDVTAIVEDDGGGFDADAALARPPAGRLGLVGMRERLSLVGGTLEVESGSGAGTSVFARVPVPTPPEGGGR